MPRLRRDVSIDVDPTSAKQLLDVGGRFQHGLHVVVRDPEVKAWIPEQGRTASGPPKFVGRMKRDSDQTVLAGVIEEARVDQFNAVLWVFLITLGMFFIAMGVVAEARDESGGVLGIVFGAVLVPLCTLFAVSGQRGRASTFSRKSCSLVASLHDWAGAR